MESKPFTKIDENVPSIDRPIENTSTTFNTNSVSNNNFEDFLTGKWPNDSGKLLEIFQECEDIPKEQFKVKIAQHGGTLNLLKKLEEYAKTRKKNQKDMENLAPIFIKLLDEIEEEVYHKPSAIKNIFDQKEILFNVAKLNEKLLKKILFVLVVCWEYGKQDEDELSDEQEQKEDDDFEEPLFDMDRDDYQNIVKILSGEILDLYLQ